MDLRPYQREAEAAILGEWDAGILRTLLVLPTGCGKTIVFSKVIEDRVRAGDRVLVLAHRGELLEQAADKTGASHRLTLRHRKGGRILPWELVPCGGRVRTEPDA